MTSVDVPFKALSAGAAGSLARLTSFPLDAVRLQMINSHTSSGTYNIMKEIIRKQGIQGLFKGCISKLPYQLLASGLTIGGYDTLKTRTIEYNRENPEGYNISARIGAGFAAGGTASFVTEPRTIGNSPIKVTSPIADAIERYRKEIKGVTILEHIGILKNYGKQYLRKLLQNGFTTVAEVVSYDVIKDYLIENHNLKDKMPVHILSAILCGCFTVLSTGPFYSIRNQYFSKPPGTYRNILACSKDMFRTGGLHAFYPLFSSNLVRLIIFNVTLWTSYEQLKHIYPKWKTRQTID